MNNAAPPLDRTFSLYLDAVRFVTAALVVLAHYLQHGIVPGGAACAPAIGRQAVIIFFVLSGFVIAYTTEQKRLSAVSYAAARFARIYSVALPVLVLAFAGALVAAGLFGAPVDSSYELAKPWIYLPFHLLFAGEHWTMSDTPPWLAPYWSLGYEVWYYVFFGVLFYLRGQRRLWLGALVFALLGYKLWLLLPVWLSGVWLYRWQKQHRLPVTAARIGWAASLALMVAYIASGAHVQLRALGMALWPFPQLPLGSAELFVFDYVVCLIVLANFMCARWARLDLLLRVAMPVRLLSSYTFTLYLAHGLVISAWLTFAKPDGSLSAIALVSAGIASLTWSLGLATGGLRRELQAAFEGCAKRLRNAARIPHAAALAEDDTMAVSADRT